MKISKALSCVIMVGLLYIVQYSKLYAEESPVQIMDVRQLEQQAKSLQKKIREAQELLAKTLVVGSSGDSKVQVKLFCDYNVEGVKINMLAHDKKSTELLEDLIIVAFNDAKAKAKESSELLFAKILEEINEIGIPNIFGLKQQATSKMGEAQELLAKTLVVGSSGDSKVQVKLFCDYNVEGVKINMLAHDKKSTELLEDLIIVAFNDAKAKAKESSELLFAKILEEINEIFIANLLNYSLKP